MYTNSDSKNTHIQFALQPPGRTFRFVWLLLGLGAGYVISLFSLPSVTLLSLLAILTGLSANWSS